MIVNIYSAKIVIPKICVKDSVKSVKDSVKRVNRTEMSMKK